MVYAKFVLIVYDIDHHDHRIVDDHIVDDHIVEEHIVDDHIVDVVVVEYKVVVVVYIDDHHVG